LAIGHTIKAETGKKMNVSGLSGGLKAMAAGSVQRSRENVIRGAASGGKTA